METRSHDGSPQPFAGISVLLTAGPTQEAIDPVRYISNHSTGKMGYALAEALAHRGARVTLVSGPTALTTQHPAIRVISVRSAAEMYEACWRVFPEATLTILAAAVADYAPKVVADQKIKKSDSEISLELVKTIDIAACLGGQKQPHQWLVGFALETEHELSHAMGKLKAKNLDLIVLNSLRDKGAAFGHDTNKITLLHRHGAIQDFPLKSKRAVAIDILDAIEGQLALIHEQ